MSVSKTSLNLACLLLGVCTASCMAVNPAMSQHVMGGGQGKDQSASGPVKRDTSQEAAGDTPAVGPCHSDEDCQDEISVCILDTGTCETCLAFDVNAQSTPQRCKDYFASVDADDGMESQDGGQPCQQESDCPLGEWCYEHARTCEKCSELESTNNREEYEERCSLWIANQAKEGSEEDNKLGLILGLIVASLVLVGLCVTLWYCRCYKNGRKDNGNGGDYNQVTGPIVAQPEDMGTATATV